MVSRVPPTAVTSGSDAGNETPADAAPVVVTARHGVVTAPKSPADATMVTPWLAASSVIECHAAR